MTYHLTWLMTAIVVVASLVVGVVTAFMFRGGVARTLWAVAVSMAFVVAGIASALLDVTWMATDEMRLAAQSVALFLLLAGFIYALRARD